MPPTEVLAVESAQTVVIDRPRVSIVLGRADSRPAVIAAPAQRQRVALLPQQRPAAVLANQPARATPVLARGQQGPSGPAGPASEEEMPYAERTDFVNDTVIYKGQAAVGSAESDPVWRIWRLDLGADGDVTKTWAGGSAGFVHSWTGRLGLSYS